MFNEICRSKESYLPAECTFSEIEILISNYGCWSIVQSGYHLIKCNLFSTWYRWKMDPLVLGNEWSGADPAFQVKKNCAERREARTFLEYFVWKITILRQKILFFPILGGKVIPTKRPKMYCGWVMFLYPSFAVCHPDTAQILYKSSVPKSTGVGGIYRYLLIFCVVFYRSLLCPFVLFYCWSVY
jgi:hypothetical protein